MQGLRRVTVSTTTTLKEAPQSVISRLSTTQIQSGTPTSILSKHIKHGRCLRSLNLIQEGHGSRLGLALNLNLQKSLSGPVSRRTKPMH